MTYSVHEKPEREYDADSKESPEDAGRFTAPTARVEADRIGRAQEEFLASVWHDLRSPLNAILGWAEVLKAGESSAADITEGLEVISRNARAQAKLIENQLDMSRIIAGKMSLDVHRLDLGAAIAAAVEGVHLAAEAAGVRMEIVEDPLAGPVSGDQDRIEQMIWNLLSNAIKFTPQGGAIRIKVERANSHVNISVSDTGQGIGPDVLPEVFDRFSQHEGPLTKHHHGLGLAIVKHLAELHGGSVRAESGGLGKGSIFIISLPISVERAGVAA